MTKQEILDKFNDIDFVYNDSSKHETLSRMIDELLKEQEPVEPIRGEDMDTSSACWWYVCPSCRIAIDYQDRFCRHCGQPLKWE